jgi:hypothetical protein
MRKSLVLTIVAVATALPLAACGPRAVHAPDSPPAIDVAGLQFVGHYELRPVDALRSARPGGVSGIAVDPTTKEIIGISDDHPDNRVFIFEMSKPGRPFQVDLRAYFPLPLGPGAPSEQDSEGIALTRSSHMFISSEGLPRIEPRVQPAIVEYTRRVDYVGRLTIPSKFLQPASGPLNHGVRENEGFESLTLTPDEERLFTASETSLAQDGEGATFVQGTTARLLEFVSEGGQFVARREFPYPLGPVPRVEFTPRFMINGLVELLALSHTEFLSMERGYAEEAGDDGRRATFIRIFRVSLDDATDISGMESIRGRDGLRPVRKRLLLDVNAVKGLPPELDVPAFDNFEGMCFGPTLPDGSRTLLIVSDDNFSPRERTWFLLFRIIK